MNEPTRPGCEMCAANRPTEYQIPKEYQLTEREKRRLEQEKRSETLTKQVSNWWNMQSLSGTFHSKIPYSLGIL